MLLLSHAFFFIAFFVAVLLGGALLHTGLQAWQTPTARRWLARSFAVLFATCGVLLLVVSAAALVLWW